MSQLFRFLDQNKKHDVWAIYRYEESVEAFGFKVGDLFYLLKGSTIRNDCVPSCSQRIKRYRDALLRSPLVEVTDAGLTLTRNVLLNSESGAASIVTGSSKSGMTWDCSGVDPASISDYVAITKSGYVSDVPFPEPEEITTEVLKACLREQDERSCPPIAYLYIYDPDDWDDGLKIGRTTSPSDRERQSKNSSTFDGGGGEMVYEVPIFVYDDDFMERIAHSFFSARINRDRGGKEWFNIELEDAKAVLNAVSVYSATFKRLPCN